MLTSGDCNPLNKGICIFLKKVYPNHTWTSVIARAIYVSSEFPPCLAQLGPVAPLPARGVSFWRFSVIMREDITEIYDMAYGSKSGGMKKGGKKGGKKK